MVYNRVCNNTELGFMSQNTTKIPGYYRNANIRRF